MHVCLVALDYPTSTSGGGVGNQTRLLGVELVRRGHSVSVIALGESRCDEPSIDEGVRVFTMRRGPLHWYVSKMPILGALFALPIRELEDSWAAYRLVRAVHRAEPIDVIEATETGALALALLATDVPLVVRLHGEIYTFQKYTPPFEPAFAVRLQRFLQRLALRRAPALVSPSEAHAGEIEAELGLKRGAVTVVPNAVDVRNLGERRSAGSSEANPTVFVFAGRLERRKGVLPLLEAFAQVVRSVPEARLIFAGASHASLPSAEIDEAIARYSLEKHVELRGHMAWADVVKLYRQASIAILPSYYETFGVSAAESMVLGVPTVVADGGALRELVVDGESGIVVRAGYSEGLAQAMLRTLTDGELRQKIAEGGRRRVTQNYHVEALADRTLDVYKSRLDSSELTVAEHVFVAPHFDDTVLSAGGSMAGLVGAGVSVRALTVFGGVDKCRSASAFVRHLQAKWRASGGGYDRASEDRAGMEMLAVGIVEQWEWPEAPCRLRANGVPLYASYEQLQGPLAAEDQPLVAELASKISTQGTPIGASRFYFPLGVGRHVDHQIMFWVGMTLKAEGRDVMFYEDFPYVESYRAKADMGAWRPTVCPIRLEPKIRATLSYRSQAGGLGPSEEVIRGRLIRYAWQVGQGGRPGERFWTLPAEAAAEMLQTRTPVLPLEPRRKSPIGSLREFAASFRSGDPIGWLEPGEGTCLMVGRAGRAVREKVAEQGYRPRDMHAFDEESGPEQVRVDALIALEDLSSVRSLQELVQRAAVLLDTGGLLYARISQRGEGWSAGARNLSLWLDFAGFRDVRCAPSRNPLRRPLTFSARFTGR